MLPQTVGALRFTRLWNADIPDLAGHEIMQFQHRTRVPGNFHLNALHGGAGCSRVALQFQTHGWHPFTQAFPPNPLPNSKPPC